MRNIKFIIEYDGTKYNGWQSQKNGIGIQEMITNAIHQVTGEEIKINGSGRTDAGVHAMGQTANFLTNSTIPIEKFPTAVNSFLPRDIVIKSAEEMDERFHARFSARGKKYMYIINKCHINYLNTKL